LFHSALLAGVCQGGAHVRLFHSCQQCCSLMVVAFSFFMVSCVGVSWLGVAHSL
jgi:hypothetical protein